MLWRAVYGLILCPLHPNNVFTHFCKDDLCINKEICNELKHCASRTLRVSFLGETFLSNIEIEIEIETVRSHICRPLLIGHVHAKYAIIPYMSIIFHI